MQRLCQRLVSGVFPRALKAMAASFTRQAQQGRKVARATLRQILQLNGNTEWGRSRGLHRPDALGVFADLPLTTYADYAPYIERAAHGEPGMLTGEPITYFAISSGTTGPQKLIPVTRRQTRLIMRHMLVPIGLAIQAGLLGPMRGRSLQIITEKLSDHTPGGIPRGAATSNGLNRMARIAPLLWTSPMAVVRIQEQAAARYLHLLFALREEHLWSVISFFPATLLFALRDLQRRAGELLPDLADGTITRQLDLPAAVRRELTTALGRHPERARTLMALWEHGRFTARDIWPEVGAVLTAGSGTFRFYVDQLRPYLGGVPVLSPIYSASEGAVGVGLPTAPDGYALAPAAAYHELVPAEVADRPDARPCAPDTVEPGRTYEVVLTTYAGLTRYRLGDLVQVLGFYGQVPVVEFLQRRGQVINVAGEKTGERQITLACAAACQEAGTALVDYLVTPDPDYTPARYLLLVEGVPEKSAAGTAGYPDLARLLHAFDRHLRRTAPSYDAHRRRGELAPMAALVLQPGSFERFRDQQVAAGASANQVKVPHAAPDPGFVRRHFAAETLTCIESDGPG